MKEKKVIFLISQTLDQRNHDRFGLQSWKKAEWEIEVWDMTPLLFPEVWNYNQSNGVVVLDDPINIIIKSINDIPVVEKVDGISIFVDLINNTEPLYLKVKSAFFDAGWSCLFLKLASLPEPKMNLIAKLKELLFIQFTRIKYFKNYLSAKSKNSEFRKFSNRTYIAVSGYRTYQNALSITIPNNIIKAHSFDYDQYISLKSNPPESGIGVFLDEDMPYHSDFIYNNIPSIVSAERYFNAIKNFFSIIEEKNGIKFVVAAHPRSNYNGDRSWCYENYPVEKNNTAALIQKSSFVVAHSSASIQLAVIYNKPILLITTDEIEKSSYHRYISEFSRELGCDIINVDNFQNLDDITFKSVDEEKYEQYKFSHVTMLEHHVEKLWDIIISELQKKLTLNISVTITSLK